MNRFEDKADRSFIIKKVFVFDKGIGQYAEINFVVGYGILLGYSMPDVLVTQPDPNNIKVDSFQIEYFGEDEFENIKSIFSVSELKLIDPVDVYEVELDGKIYYHIKELGDGDFIGIDKEKNIYKITHDPYEVLRLDKPLEKVLEEN